jgi:hypothetical protein
MAVNLNQPPIAKKLLSLTAATTTGTSAAFSLPFADAYTFYLNVTTAGQTTCYTVFLTSPDQGTTYVGVPWKFAGVTTVTGTYVLNVRNGLGGANDISLPTGQGAVVDTTGNVVTAVSLQAIVDPRYMKFAYTIAGTSPVADLYVIAWPKGSMGVND